MSLEARFRVDRRTSRLDVDLTLPGRGVSAIFGPSGAGKTTLLRAIAGLDRHPGGRLSIDGVVWQDEDRFVPPHRRPLGYVFQEPSLFAHLDVRRNVDYGARRVPASERRVSCERAIELLGIGHLLARRPDSLSGGERQRVAIARALAVSPRLLLMDEPLAGLDRALKREILPYLESLQRELEVPIVYVSHSTDEVARLADHLVLLDRGKATASGPLAELLTRLDQPLAHGEEAEAVVEAEVVEHDDAYHLTHLDFSGGRLTIVRRQLPLGSRVRLRIAARDVSLTLEPQSATSILNIFPVTVEALAPEDEARVTVRLMAGEDPLLARVTRKSAEVLRLTPGSRVYAQAKSIALLS